MSNPFKTIAAWAVAACVLLSATVAVAGPEGRYKVVGTNPGGTGQYTGTVKVVATGKTYDVVWRIGGTRYTGVGILTETVLSVAYYGSNLTGVAVYRERKDGTWNGAWAVKGAGRIGTEVWTPR